MCTDYRRLAWIPQTNCKPSSRPAACCERPGGRSRRVPGADAARPVYRLDFARAAESCDLQELPKQLMGLEPTTFCWQAEAEFSARPGKPCKSAGFWRARQKTMPGNYRRY